MNAETLGAKYGREEGLWLVQATAGFWAEAEDGEYECVDNHRLALVGEASDEAEYDEAARTGCCGSVDVELGPSPSGRTYRYGFNHGH